MKLTRISSLLAPALVGASLFLSTVLAAQAKPITIPAGTVLLVRMADGVSSRSAPGANFTTKLEYNLSADGVVAVPAGSVVYGKVQSATQAGRSFGRSTLDIRLATMVVAGSPVPIMTTSYAQAGASEGAKTVKAAGVGAIIGNNTGGSSGGGAAWGAGAASLKKGETISVGPGTLLEFTLTQPVTVQVGP
jgi:hypothetical protein